MDNDQIVSAALDSVHRGQDVASVATRLCALLGASAACNATAHFAIKEAEWAMFNNRGMGDLGYAYALDNACRKFL